MAQRAQQTREDSPRFTTRFTIDCVLPLTSTQLQAVGCVLECLEDGHKLITPDYLRAGDLVRVQLWLEGEEDFIDIPLAVVSKVHTPWITVGVIRVSPSDRLRMKRLSMLAQPCLLERLLTSTIFSFEPSSPASSLRGINNRASHFQAEPS